jgi:hypothetical protein
MNQGDRHSSYHQFSKVPTTLFLEIREFLQPKQYFHLITSTKTFQDIKFETWRIKVRVDVIDNFLHNTEFRNHVLLKIKNPKQQLCFSSFTRIDDLSLLLAHKFYYVHINACNLQEVPHWIEKLNEKPVIRLASNQTIQNFNGFLSHSKRMFITLFDSLSDLTAFTHLKELELFGCGEISEVNCLRNLHRLKLENCPKVSNIQELGNIHHLSLNYCPLITDISRLTDNYRITILGCRNIDRSTISLHRVVHLKTDLYQIYMNSLKKRKEVERLKQLKTLSLIIPFHHQTIYMGSSIFVNLLEISLTRCIIDDLSPLSGIPVIALTDCKIGHLIGLSCVPTLSPRPEGPNVIGASSVYYNNPSTSSPSHSSSTSSYSTLLPSGVLNVNTSSPTNNNNNNSPSRSFLFPPLGLPPAVPPLVPPLPLVPSLAGGDVFITPRENNNINNSNTTTGGGNPVRKIKFIKLDAIRNIEDFSPLNHIPHVHIKACPDFMDAGDVDNVHHLILQGCQDLTSIAKLRKVRYLELNACPKVTSLQGLEKVGVIEIIHCPQIQSLEGLGENEKIVVHRVESSFQIQNEKLVAPFYHHGIQQEDELITHTFLRNNVP